jgi:RNA polymerase sigma-70 factor (ECF subfamily)
MAALPPEVAARFRAGDLEALRQIVDLYQNRLFGLGLKLLGQQDEAADFIQDSFLRAFEKRHTYDSSRPFEPWLFKVAVNVGRARFRQRREIPVGDVFPQRVTEAKGEQMVLQEERQLKVQKALVSVTLKYRECLVLRFESDMSLKEISKALGISLGTVKSRLSRGLQAFHKAYVALGGE